MSCRTSPDLVAKAIGPEAYDASFDLDTAIEIAGAFVDDAVACAARKGITITSERAALMEKWVAAWVYTQMDPLYASRSDMGASGSFRDQDYKGLACKLDPSGCLENILEKRAKTKAKWLGRNRSSTSTYEQRDALQ